MFHLPNQLFVSSLDCYALQDSELSELRATIESLKKQSGLHYTHHQPHIDSPAYGRRSSAGHSASLPREMPGTPGWLETHHVSMYFKCVYSSCQCGQEECWLLHKCHLVGSCQPICKIVPHFDGLFFLWCCITELLAIDDWASYYSRHNIFEKVQTSSEEIQILLVGRFRVLELYFYGKLVQSNTSVWRSPMELGKVVLIWRLLYMENNHLVLEKSGLSIEMVSSLGSIAVLLRPRLVEEFHSTYYTVSQLALFDRTRTLGETAVLWKYVQSEQHVQHMQWC